MNVARQELWYNLFFHREIENKVNYDTAISFQGGLGMYYIRDFINSSNKILWVQSDYRVFNRNLSLDNKYIVEMNNIVAVSKKCADIFEDLFPLFKGNLEVLSPFLSENQIQLMSQEQTEIYPKGDYNIISVARLDPNKGFDLAIPAVSKLVKSGYKIIWKIVGDGPSFKKINSQIIEYNMEKNIFLLGKKSNPYKYINNADIFLHPSRFEGKSVAIEEAMILKKAIVVTNYPTISDQIVHNFNGIIVPISIEGIFLGLKELIDQPDVILNLQNNLKNEDIKKIDNHKINKLLF